jgi:hypothetical protein
MKLLSEELNLFHFVNIITNFERRVKQYTAFSSMFKQHSKGRSHNDMQMRTKPPEISHTCMNCNPFKIINFHIFLAVNNLTRCSSFMTENSKPTTGMKRFNEVVNIPTSCRLSISYPTSNSK